MFPSKTTSDLVAYFGAFGAAALGYALFNLGLIWLADFLNG